MGSTRRSTGLLRVAGLVTVLFCSATLLGCGADREGDAAGSAGGASGAGGAGATGGQGGGAGQAPCNEEPASIPSGAQCVRQVRGTVIDDDGNGVAALAVSVCGPVCFYGSTDSSGAFDVEVGAHIVGEAFSTLPHGRPNRTSFYFALPVWNGDVVQMGALRVLDLPASGSPLVVATDQQGAPAQSGSSNGATLVVPAGVSVKLDVEDVAQGDLGKQFRALEVPAARRSDFVDPKLGIESLWAFSPFEAAFVSEATGAEAKVSLSLANSPGFPPGTKVELLALGSYLFPSWVAPAAFDAVATATVSADGARIEMDPGQGIGYLTWLGVRQKP